MIQLFLIPVILLSMIFYPVFVLQHVNVFLKDAFAATTRYNRVINWIGFGVSSALFLISGTVVLATLITLFTGGTISVP